MEAYRKLQDWWEATGSVIETEAIAEDRVADLERGYCIELPADFREYLGKSSPLAGEQSDENDCCWWDFDRIRNIPEEFTGEVGAVIGDDAKHYLFFCDFAVWCWAWAICCAPNANYGKVAFIGGGEYDRIIADSFSEFVENYVADWYLVSTETGMPLLEIERNVRRFAARIDAPELHLPHFGALEDFHRPHIEMDENLQWVGAERSKESEIRTVRYYYRMMYWIYQNVTFNMAFDYAVLHRRPDEDLRRLLWKKQLELLATLSRLWKEHRLDEIAVTLSAHPFRDGGPAGLEDAEERQ